MCYEDDQVNISLQYPGCCDHGGSWPIHLTNSPDANDTKKEATGSQRVPTT